jgi:hypothetical protein
VGVLLRCATSRDSVITEDTETDTGTHRGTATAELLEKNKFFGKLGLCLTPGCGPQAATDCRNCRITRMTRMLNARVWAPRGVNQRSYWNFVRAGGHATVPCSIRVIRGIRQFQPSVARQRDRSRKSAKNQEEPLRLGSSVSLRGRLCALCDNAVRARRATDLEDLHSP